MSLDNSWFTEPVDQTGTAFSLKLGERVHAEQTPYQKIEIYRTETFGYLMTIDGCTMVSTRDNFLYHEMMSHPALNSHPSPRDVVVVGGGDCGTLREVLKHPEVK
ncbi:MAG TPA: polyamine aminopropyltransferase, partial [Nevskia sp.]|nr:polyamine aminopropyltransferase [Nevskia sp.]